jgi:hypothetical protein
MHRPNLFDSFFMGGFECSTHRRHDNRRLDLIAATAHDTHAAADYHALRRYGLRTVRDGLRWHLIERSRGRYDWSSFLPQLRAAREAGVQVIWDLCHYGVPDHVDVWSPAFVDRLAQFAGSVAALLRDEGVAAPLYCPINEISYWSWAGGDMGQINPLAQGRGTELKVQLVRASIAAIEAIRAADPRARLVQVDPLINVVPNTPQDAPAAEQHRLAQYQAWDMLVGTQWPGLGGSPQYLDIIGVNYYSNNQWYLGGETIWRDQPAHRPLHQMLAEACLRYRRPLLIAETGAEAEQRAPWLHHVCNQVLAALEQNVPIEGLCLYPVLDYPGWANERLCATGLLGLADTHGQRAVCEPLAQALQQQQARFDALLSQREAAA